jgi:hypothetical protein
VSRDGQSLLAPSIAKPLTRGAVAKVTNALGKDANLGQDLLGRAGQIERRDLQLLAGADHVVADG